MKITFFYRKQRPHGNYSIEQVFGQLAKELGYNNIKVEHNFASFFSNGVLPRILNIIEAVIKQGDINHITGDIHYVGILLKRNRTILTIHDCGFINNTKGIKYFLLKIFWLQLPVKSCKYVTTVSEASKKDILRYTRCRSEKIHVIPNPIPKSFSYSPKAFNKLKPNILQVGTAFNKNIGRLALALQGIYCDLIIVGVLDDEDRRVLQEYKIEFQEKRNLSNNEMIEMYRKCDMVTLISTLEGFGLPILEAQATGRPVITSNISSMPEVAGKGACLVNPYDIKSIRNGIKQVIDADAFRDEIVQLGLINIRNYQIESVTAKYLNLYKNIKQ